MLEVNYDAASALGTWTQVAELARHLNHFELASRAVGEQGIAAFILGEICAAKKDVLEAWTLAKVLHDPAASVRYASVYGAGRRCNFLWAEVLLQPDEDLPVTFTQLSLYLREQDAQVRRRVCREDSPCRGWKLYAAAKKRHEANLQIKRRAFARSKRFTRSKS